MDNGSLLWQFFHLIHTSVCCHPRKMSTYWEQGLIMSFVPVAVSTEGASQSAVQHNKHSFLIEWTWRQWLGLGSVMQSKLNSLVECLGFGNDRGLWLEIQEGKDPDFQFFTTSPHLEQPPRPRSLSIFMENSCSINVFWMNEWKKKSTQGCVSLFSHRLWIYCILFHAAQDSFPVS